MISNINLISLIGAFALVFGSIHDSHAKKKLKQKSHAPSTPSSSPANEVYSATDSESPGSLSLSDKGLWEMPAPAVKAEPLQGDMESSLPQTEIKPVHEPSLPIKINEYDSVDSAQIESISARMKLVEQILRKHKRAYDYRANTTKELMDVMKYLDASHKK